LTVVTGIHATIIIILLFILLLLLKINNTK